MSRPAPAMDVPGQATLKAVLGTFVEPTADLEVLRERAWFSFFDACIEFRNRGKGKHQIPWESYEELRAIRYRCRWLWMNWLDLNHQCAAAGIGPMDPLMMNDGYTEDSNSKLWRRTGPAAVRR